LSAVAHQRIRMMCYSHIGCFGTTLEGPDWLAEIWPTDLPLNLWPTFCGPSSGIGDVLVPDRIYGAHIAPACFIHDIEFSITPKKILPFILVNLRFRRNLLRLVALQLKGEKVYPLAVLRCHTYTAAVMYPGWRYFMPTPTPRWQDNPTVKEKLQRLAYADMGVPHG
jgi:hypothetical protein